MGFMKKLLPAAASFIPGVGPLVSAGLGLALGSEGGSAEGEAVKQDTGEASLKNIFDYSLPMAKTAMDTGNATTTTGLNTINTGLNTLNQPKDYWSNILSGNRPAQMAAIAPEVNAINEQDAARRAQEAAYGTSRGGGTNAADQAAESNRLAKIDNALFAARQPAAAGLTNIAQQQGQMGNMQSDIGIQQLAAGLKEMGLSEDTVKALITSASGKRTQDVSAHKDTMADLGALIANVPFDKIGNLFKSKPKPNQTSNTAFTI